VAKILKIESLLHKKPKHLSGGQRQRVALGRAIIRKPNVFLFDEPLSNLDAKLRVHMRAEIIDLHRRLKSTAIYVTHDQVEAMTLGDRIVILNKGRIQQVDTPSELYANPANMFVAGFIGTPPMNFIEGRVIKRDEGIMFTDLSKSFEVELPLDHPLSSHVEKEVVLGIRSEDIYNQGNTGDRRFKVLSCKIEFIEKLGHEIYAYIQLQNQQIISRLKADTEIEKGSKINLYFDIHKMYFFDKLTGANLR
jgi:multiple sugar transport system ATP-binding protein